MNQLFRVKPIETLVAETEVAGRTLRKTLGPVHLIALGIGAIIGAGIFTTIGTGAVGDANRPGAGPALMLSFLLTAIACSFTALSYAEFAAMVPVAGSAYTYSYATLGELIAWIIGWDLILEYAVGNIAVAVSWSGFFHTLIEGLGIHLPPWLTTDFRTARESAPAVVAAAPRLFGVPIVFNVLAFGIVLLITALLVWGVKESARANAVIIAIKLLVLTFFIIVSIKYVHPANWHPFAPNGFSGIGAGAAVTFFAFIGFDAVSTTAEECRNPRRDLPIGIIGSLVICAVFYVIVAAVFTGMVPFHAMKHWSASQLSESLTAAMRVAVMPNWMIGIVALGSVLALTAVLLVFQMGQPRIFFAMARDGFLPKVFARVHPRFKTPYVTTIVTGLVVGTVAGVANINEAVDLTNIGTLFAFVLVSLGIMVLRRRDPNRPRPFRVPLGGFVFPSLAIVCCVYLIYKLPVISWVRFVVWLVIGLVIYFSYGYRHSRLRRELSGK